MTAAVPKPATKLLEIRGVSVRLGSKTVLRDVNAEIFDVERPGVTTGQIVGILGPSGVGKSTLLRVIAGLLKHDSGIVSIGPQQKPVERGMVGMVSQSCALFRNRTVLGNLQIAAGPNKNLDRSLAMMHALGLDNLGRMYPSELSGGQRQRVAIAQQLLCSEHFLVLDEPFSALDYQSIQNTMKLLQEVANRDELNTLVLVTHDIGAAISICDHLWVMGWGLNEPFKEGARIVKEIDLIERGLCWQPDVRLLPTFAETRREIEILMRANG